MKHMLHFKPYHHIRGSLVMTTVALPLPLVTVANVSPPGAMVSSTVNSSSASITSSATMVMSIHCEGPADPGISVNVKGPPEGFPI